MTHYATVIRSCLSNYPIEQGDERRIEAWMRLRYGTLDALDMGQFRNAVHDAWHSTRRDGRELSDQLANTYGL